MLRRKSPKTQRSVKKLLRDSILGIKNAPLRRLAVRAGVKNVSSEIYEEIRGKIKAFVENLVSRIIITLDNTRKKIVTVNDINFALGMQQQIYKDGGEYDDDGCDCSGYDDGDCSGYDDGEDEQHLFDGRRRRSIPTDDGEDEQHLFDGRRRRSPKTIKKINSTGLEMQKMPFTRYVREVTQDANRSDIKFSKESLHIIQEITELYVVKLFQGANTIANHCGRNTVKAKDLAVVENVCFK